MFKACFLTVIFYGILQFLNVFCQQALFNFGLTDNIINVLPSFLRQRICFNGGDEGFVIRICGAQRF